TAEDADVTPAEIGGVVDSVASHTIVVDSQDLTGNINVGDKIYVDNTDTLGTKLLLVTNIQFASGDTTITVDATFSGGLTGWVDADTLTIHTGLYKWTITNADFKLETTVGE